MSRLVQYYIWHTIRFCAGVYAFWTLPSCFPFNTVAYKYEIHIIEHIFYNVLTIAFFLESGDKQQYRGKKWR